MKIERTSRACDKSYTAIHPKKKYSIDLSLTPALLLTEYDRISTDIGVIESYDTSTDLADVGT